MENGEQGQYERFDANGGRRPLLPGELAQVDQFQARFRHLTRNVLLHRQEFRMAFMAGDDEALAVLSATMGGLFREQFPNHGADEASYMMYLIDLVEQSQEWATHIGAVVNNTFRMMSALLPEDHPVKAIPGFDPATIDAEMDAIDKAIAAHQDTIPES